MAHAVAVVVEGRVHHQFCRHVDQTCVLLLQVTTEHDALDFFREAQLELFTIRTVDQTFLQVSLNNTVVGLVDLFDLVLVLRVATAECFTCYAQQLRRVITLSVALVEVGTHVVVVVRRAIGRDWTTIQVDQYKVTYGLIRTSWREHRYYRGRIEVHNQWMAHRRAFHELRLLDDQRLLVAVGSTTVQIFHLVWS
ncbi:hypothetical protein D3C71_983860 [compost metagenome]